MESSTRRVFFSRTMKHELHTSDRVTLVLVARTGPWSRPESTVLDSHGKHRDRRSQPAGSETEWRAFGERRRAPACRPPPGVQAQRALATRAAPARAASWMAPQDPTTGSRRAYLRMLPRRPSGRRRRCVRYGAGAAHLHRLDRASFCFMRASCRPVARELA